MEVASRVEERNNDRERAIRRVTIIGAMVNLSLAILKVVVGALAKSQALFADGIHSLSDLVTDALVVVGSHYWSAPPDKEHPHGHARIELLVAAVIGIALAAVGIGLIVRAVSSLQAPESSRPGMVVLLAALVSIAAKEGLFRWTFKVGKAIRSSSLTANAWHHRSDAFSSVPVVVAVVGNWLWPELTFLDPGAALIVSALIIAAAVQITFPAVHKLLDVGATEKQIEEIIDVVLRTKGVRAMHKLRTRYIGACLQVDLHVLVDPDLTVKQGHEIANEVRQRLLDQIPHVADVLVHIDPFDASEIDEHTRLA